MVDSFCIAAIVTGFDGAVAAPPASPRRSICRHRAISAIPNPETGAGDGFSDVIHLEKRRLTKDVRMMSTATDRITR